MFKKKIVLLSGVIAIVLFVISGCYKTNTYVVSPGSEITQTLSFSSDIQPIFTASCALSGCHAAGAKVPNLTKENAYKALIDGAYLKASDPDNSPLILWLTGKKSPVMPLGAGPNQDINAKVYAWIKQGAKNN